MMGDPDMDRIRFSLNIPAHSLPAILGEKGNVLKEIIEESGASVIIQPKDDYPGATNTKRILKLEGSWAQTQAAQRRILDIMKNSLDNVSKDLTEETLLMIPTMEANRLKGEVLTRIEQDTGTSIHIYDPNVSEARNSLVVIRGIYSHGENDSPSLERLTTEEVMRLGITDIDSVTLNRYRKPAKVRAAELSAVSAIKYALHMDMFASDIPSPNDVKAYMEIPVSSRFSGSVIGQGAYVVKNLEENSGARIKLSKEGIKYTTSTEIMRFVSADGTGLAVRKAYKLIIENIRQAMDRITNESESSDTYEVPLSVPDHLIAVIIGRGGRALKDLQEHTRTKIHVEHSARGSSRLVAEARAVEIRGKREDVEAAQRLIVERLIVAATGDMAASSAPPVNPALIVMDNFYRSSNLIRGVENDRDRYGARGRMNDHHHDRRRSRSRSRGRDRDRRRYNDPLPPPSSRYQQDNSRYRPSEFGGGGGGESGQFSSSAAATATAADSGGGGGNKDTMTVDVPMAQVGAVIGQRGAMIKNICANSGARLHIQAREEVPPGATSRKVTITGSVTQVQQAFELVQKILAENPVPSSNQQTKSSQSNSYSNNEGDWGSLPTLAGEAGSSSVAPPAPSLDFDLLARLAQTLSGSAGGSNISQVTGESPSKFTSNNNY